MTRKLVIGTRGSDLALWQAHHVASWLRAHHPDHDVDLRVIRTRGDIVLDRQLSEIGGKGLFIKEIEQALRDGEIDLAVHSLKDMPWDQPADLAIVCVPERAGAFDILCAREAGQSLARLRKGARVGTGSLRRGTQLRMLRPDLEIVPIRGNVQTRLDKRAPERDDLDAVVLAQAGLARLGIAEEGFSVLAPPDFLPAPAQGALGIEIRSADEELRAMLAPFEDARARTEVEAERACLHGIEGDCHTPFAAYAQVEAGAVHLQARLLDVDGRATTQEASAELPGDEADLAVARALGSALAERLLAAHGAPRLA